MNRRRDAKQHRTQTTTQRRRREKNRGYRTAEKMKLRRREDATIIETPTSSSATTASQVRRLFVGGARAGRERERKILMFGVLGFFISRGLGFHGVRRYKKEIRGLGSNLTDQKKGETLEFIFQNKPPILKDGNPTLFSIWTKYRSTKCTKFKI